ncbi:MAG: leucine-rich repeat domain-containing protein [Clostridiales bacterium]|nr:leucine-rich repeat domain-containing protein [Clostridiales bacterium]
MKHQWKRLAALAMVLSMCLSLLSANAWATEVSGGGYTEDSFVAESETADDSSAPETEETGEAAPVEDEAAEEAESADTADTSEAEELTEEEDLASVEETAEDGESDTEGEIALTAGESDESDALVSATADEEDDSVLDSGTCGDNLTWTLNSDYVLIISGTGDMTDWSSSSSIPWYSYIEKITQVVIESGVTSIGRYAFYNCTGLTSVVIPDSVTSIGNYAFRGCTGLISVSIPDSVTSIGDAAFYSCTSLTSVTIPDGVTRIGSETFYCCYSLASVTIPDSVTSISSYAFYYCTSLTSVTIPDGVTSIGAYAFEGCSKLASVTIPDSVTYIGSSAFRYCASLTSVTIPDGVTTIGSYAFYSCGKLTSVTIPDSVTSIGVYAFDGCYKLTDVYYGSTEDDWNTIDIGSGNEYLTYATIHYTESGETGGDADPTYYTRYAYASKGSSVTLSAYLLDKNGNEVDFSADSSYTFRWVKVTDAFVVYDEDEGTGLWEQTESDVLGTDSTYTIASVSADDYFDEGSDSLYYYICYIYQDGVLVALDYVNILDPSVWSGTSSNIYANVGDSVTLKAYLESANGFALDFDTFDYDDITFAWVKVTCSMDSASGDWVCKAGDVLGTDASYTIDALTTGDFYNTDSDTYYYYVCYIYQYGYQIASDTVYISGHIWDDGVVTTEPTCTVEGVMTYTCTVCGETYTVAIPATGTSDSGTTDDSSNSSTSDSSSSSSSSNSSSSSSASDAEASGVETGDSASLTLWAALAGIALLAMATILATRRRVSHKK